MYEAARAGRGAEARAAFAAILPLVQLLFAEPNPSPLKAALAHRGAIACGAVRLPLVPPSAALSGRLAAALDASADLA